MRFIPERMEKVYYNWMENIKDWCISRQLWWGHRIPAWYCADCGETIVAKETPAVCPKCGCTHLHQDEDTLDTWFSSALWPFSTLGWPDQTPELKYFYPTDTLVTGYDIIFFWVARMIFSGLENMDGVPPFNTVFFHGLVRDAQGRKMSKSLGNGVDPLEIIAKYGADALRFTLATGNSPGNDMRFSDDKVEASRNFANKIWNAARFIRMNIDGKETPAGLPETLTTADRWILSRYNTVVREVTDNLDHFELGVAVAKLYDFLWDEFCDWYIEFAKILMQDDATAQSARQVLVYVLRNTLQLLHPFMPFITEEIWQSLPHDGESIMVAQWPKYDEALNSADTERRMTDVMDAIRAVRNRRSEMNVPPSKKAHVFVATAEPEVFAENLPLMQRLAYASGVTLGDAFDMPGAVTMVTRNAKLYIPMDELVDKAAERARLTKERESVVKQLTQCDAKLGNETFLSKAPAQVVEGVRTNAESLRKKLALIDESLAALG